MCSGAHQSDWGTEGRRLWSCLSQLGLAWVTSHKSQSHIYKVTSNPSSESRVIVNVRQLFLKNDLFLQRLYRYPLHSYQVVSTPAWDNDLDINRGSSECSVRGDSTKVSMAPEPVQPPVESFLSQNSCRFFSHWLSWRSRGSWVCISVWLSGVLYKCLNYL